jgi:hypothetical protein
VLAVIEFIRFSFIKRRLQIRTIPLSNAVMPETRLHRIFAPMRAVGSDRLGRRILLLIVHLNDPEYISIRSTAAAFQDQILRLV